MTPEERSSDSPQDPSAPEEPRRRVRLGLVRLLLKVAPSERRRLFFVTLVVGAIGGVVAVAFHLALRWAEHAMIDRALSLPGWNGVLWSLLVPVLGGLFCGVLLQYSFPDARGSGIPQVKVAYAVRGGRMPIRIVFGKFLVSVLQIGSGMSLGREGPTVQITAGLSSALGRAAALSRKGLMSLMPVGGAAGIAAAFNAPIAAVTFAIEEIIGDLDHQILAGIVVAAALAAAIERSILGAHPVFELSTAYGTQGVTSLVLYAALGVAAAGVSILFTDSLLGLRRRFQRWTTVPPWARPAFGGLVTGALAITAIRLFHQGGIAAIGYDTLSLALTGRLAFHVLIVLCLMKVFATAFSYGSGGAGGIFAPALFMGGMLGGAVGYLDVGLFNHPHTQVSAFALVGMGAAFAGIVRAPITSVLIIFEMTDGYGLILPLMIANMTAYGLASRWRPTPVYEALIEQDGIRIPKRGGELATAIGTLRVADAMSREIETLKEDVTISEALERTAGTDYSAFPVIDADGRYLGLIGEARMRRAGARDEGDRAVAELADPGDTTYPDEPLVRAVVLMNRHSVRQMAVLSRTNPGRLVGILTMGDVVRAQADAAVRTDRSLEPDFGEARDMLKKKDER